MLFYVLIAFIALNAFTQEGVMAAQKCEDMMLNGFCANNYAKYCADDILGEQSADDSVCMLCRTGWSTLNKGSKHLDDCKIKTCYPGTFLNVTTFQCSACDYGLYMDEYDGRICKTCPVSTTTYQTGFY
ncbi:hypothetical protein GCK32_014081 [Trichostrongylus colubriformis]|uniref:Tyrosine-protein kinase ephrin type A/B receptor-like domain-containing protein n=1 Tax=Trichostrongylus colubriformis TaxID=6319 RepID=A0AAN8G0P8_TRICO